jgi:selenocysteine lyase/cysteine desulfurase
VTDLEQYLESFDIEPGYLDWAAFGPLSTAVRAESRADAELFGTGRRTSIELVSSRAGEARALLAALLDADSDEVVLQPSTAYGLMQAIYGVRGGLLVSRADFPSLSVTAARAAALCEELTVQWFEPANGFVSVDEVAGALTDQTTAVAVSLVDFRTGYLTDLTGLRDVIGDRLLIVDAIQGFGVVDADYAAADVVCGNGYKWLRAGRGTGWARFSERARARIDPVLSGFAGVAGGLAMDEVPPPAPDARAFQVTAPDQLAASRLATALGQVQAAGVAEIAAAVADRADQVLFLAERYGIPVVTPVERERRAGIVALAPSATDAAPLAAALANRGVVFTARSGLIRLSAHAGTGEDTLVLLGDAMAEFAAGGSW